MDLTNIFGNEIKVIDQPRDIEREFTGFPGGHGVTAMHLGTRGSRIIISGRLRATGASYALARAVLKTAILAIETYQWAYSANYTYMGLTYYNLVLGPFRLIPDGSGKLYHLTAAGHVTVDFICEGRCLL